MRAYLSKHLNVCNDTKVNIKHYKLGVAYIGKVDKVDKVLKKDVIFSSKTLSGAIRQAYQSVKNILDVVAVRELG